MVESTTEKQCSSCEEVKSLASFYKSKTNSDGHENKCRDCHKRDNASNYLKNREARIAYQTAYYELNKEATLLQKKKFWEENRERLTSEKRDFYHENSERLLEVKKIYYDQNSEEICATRRADYEANPEVYRERARAYRLDHPESYRETDIRYAEANPKKRSVLGIVARAVKSGKLFRAPCEICGDEKSQGHHSDYDKPLDVIWLCQKHHSEWHRLNGEGLNAT